MTYLAHPDHPVPDEVAEGLRLHRDKELKIAERQYELTRLARPSDEERRFKAELHEATLKAAGVDIDDFRTQRSNLRKAQADRIVNNDLPTEQRDSALVPMDFRPTAPLSTDPSFWWARTFFGGTPPYEGFFADDGLHFKGKKNHDSGDLIFLNFGCTAMFELHADRIPPSSSGRWRSAPHVEIFGTLSGSSQDSFGFGDDWCKCWMIRRQTAFQFVFAPPGVSNRHIIGERVDVQNIFFSEDAPFDALFRAPGFQPMPELILTHPFPAQSIWVDLEVRFDIQLEGSAQLWIGPFEDIIIRHFQWPASPGA